MSSNRSRIRGNENNVRNLKKHNPKQITNSPPFDPFRIKGKKKMHESSTKRARLKWVENRNTLVDLDRLVTPTYTLSARRPLLDIVINILKPEASSWATMTQLVRGPDCRAPSPPLRVHPWLLFSAFFLAPLAARRGKSTATDRPLTYICFQATRVVSGRRSWFIWSPLIDFR